MANQGRRKGDPGGNRGGGPKTEAGLAVISQSHTKHGIYRMMESGFVPGCDLCRVAHLCEEAAEGGLCVQAERATAEVMTRLMSAEHIDELARDQAREYAKLVVFLEVIDRTLQVDGLFRGDEQDEAHDRDGHATKEEEGPRVRILSKGGLRPTALVDLRMRISAACLTYAEKMGLTPAARRRLRIGTAGGGLQSILDLFGELEAERRAEREGQEQGVLDADFEGIEG